MTILCNVSGPLVDLSGEVLPNTKVIIKANAVRGQYGKLKLPKDKVATSDASGILSVTLLPGLYTGHVTASGRTWTFLLSVPEETEAVLGSQTSQEAPPITATEVLEAREYRDKAREWATNPEDDPVEAGEFSALHWAAKAQQLGAVEVEKARLWAENPEDDEVAPGQFSALHHAAKSAESAGDAAASANAAALSETNAAASEAAAELAASDTAASVVSLGAIRDQIEADRAEIAVNKDLAYGYQQSAAAAVAYQNLSAVALSKAVTAVDVFVYDTSKDSDGGAWRKRCQHTSWFNETLNTATRGARREFPAVAVIVAEQDRTIIYDADDPTLPMWMIFETSWSISVGTMLALADSPAVVTCVAMMNGKLCVGSTHESAVSALHVIDFLADRAEIRGSSYRDPTRHSGIASRNVTSGFSPNNTLPALASGRINDVAMTVLPDAPVDPATGLPVPTIAVATASGVSVIRQDGPVASPANVPSTRELFFEGMDLWAVAGASYFGLQRINGPLYATAPDTSRLYTSPQGNNASPKPLSSSFLEGGVGMGGTEFALRDNVTGLIKAIWDRRDPTSAFEWGKSMVAQITSLYNTGWMPGAIRGAFLSSKETTSVVGTGEMIPDGAFDANVEGWTPAGATIVWNAGQAEVTNAIANGSVYRAFATVIGARYRLVHTADGDVTRNITKSDTATQFGTNYINLRQSGTSEQVSEFTATAETTYIHLGINSGSVGLTATFDNLSMRLVDPDRSVNNKGLIVNGTITRTPVAAGAELVGYSGFSAANYLDQPYNSALNFGTGDFCVMGWVKPGGVASTQYIIDTRNNAGNGVVMTQGATYAIGLDIGSAASGGTPIVGVWQHVVGLRRSGGLELYVNGVLVATQANTGASHNPSSKLAVGVRGGLLSAHMLGSLALLRIGATAPTPEQIRRIYEDERPLFQPEAVCTLFGASDAVVALAHDPDTGLLHAGTSAGRSVFQGLRRVSNTAVAVGAAISAVNGLVVEE